MELAAPRLGMVAKLDLVETEGGRATPVDYKRGAPPDTPEQAWEPERVQLCAQALILEENGYVCESGVLYFVAAKQRVVVPFDDALRARTRELLAAAREVAAHSVAPPPLVDSPKCPRCSLVGVCLPDEVNLLRGIKPADEASEPRRLLPARDDALPLYVQAAGARIGKRGDELVVEKHDGEKTAVRLMETSQVGVMGRVQISTQAVQELCTRGIPVLYLSHGGWFYGMTSGMTHKNVELRRCQFRAAESEQVSLRIAQSFVETKIRNCRTMLRRNVDELDVGILDQLRRLAESAREVTSAASLLGVEGTAARVYYESFARTLRPAEDEKLTFDFDGRNRRPPRDPVNALLSLAYSLLAKDLTVAAVAVGFDPYLGFYHRPRYGRPALALDLMEEFRPIIADSAVITVVNTKVIGAGDFVRRGVAVALTDKARARFIDAYERRMGELVTHPVFGYRISYRRVLEVQTRLLARFLGGEVVDIPLVQDALSARRCGASYWSATISRMIEGCDSCTVTCGDEVIMSSSRSFVASSRRASGPRWWQSCHRSSTTRPIRFCSSISDPTTAAAPIASRASGVP